VEHFDEVKINNAIHECLDRCYATDNALQEIARFVGELKASGNWTRAEIRQVDLAVHAVLHQVMIGDSCTEIDELTLNADMLALRPP